MPTRRFRYVVFDWDGTLVDSTSFIAQAILQAADDIGVAVPDRSQASHVIGLGLAQALARVVPDLPPQRIGEFAAAYHGHYRRGEEDIHLFDAARPLLAALRAQGAELAIATGKTRSGLERALRRAGLENTFTAVRCADQTHPKPHPAMLLELAQELCAAPDQMLMIGDTTHDLQMAAAARVAAVGLAQGAHPRAALEREAPLAVFDSLGVFAPWALARCCADAA